jgi:hypothetical protein
MTASPLLTCALTGVFVTHSETCRECKNGSRAIVGLHRRQGHELWQVTCEHIQGADSFKAFWRKRKAVK